MVSSLAITTFNLGNALGARLGGVVIAHRQDLATLPSIAAALTPAGFAVARYSDRRELPAVSRGREPALARAGVGARAHPADSAITLKEHIP